jgi:hypothetical protein
MGTRKYRRKGTFDFWTPKFSKIQFHHTTHQHITASPNTEQSESQQIIGHVTKFSLVTSPLGVWSLESGDSIVVSCTVQLKCFLDCAR